MPPRWRTRTDVGWLLRRQPFGEADLWLDAYTQGLGRIRVLAKGARKVTSRKGGHLQLFQRVHMTLARGQSWWILTQAQTQTWFPELRTNMQAYAAASYVAELVLRLVPEEERLPGLDPLLGQTLEAIARLPHGPQWAPRVFEWKILSLAGYRPEWDRCHRCGTPLRLGEPKAFDPQGGGVVCDGCRGPQMPWISDRAWSLLRHWAARPLPAALEKAPPQDLYPELTALGQAYVRTWMERAPKTWRVERQLEEGSPEE